MHMLSNVGNNTLTISIPSNVRIVCQSVVAISINFRCNFSVLSGRVLFGGNRSLGSVFRMGKLWVISRIFPLQNWDHNLGLPPTQ